MANKILQSVKVVVEYEQQNFQNIQHFHSNVFRVCSICTSKRKPPIDGPIIIPNPKHISVVAYEQC